MVGCQLVQPSSGGRPGKGQAQAGKPRLAHLQAVGELQQNVGIVSGGWERPNIQHVGCPARGLGWKGARAAHLGIGCEEGCGGLGRLCPAAAAACRCAADALLQCVHEQQQQHSGLLLAGRRMSSASLRLQPAGCCLHSALQRCKRLCRAAMVCAQPDGDQLLGCLLHRPPGGLRQAAGQAPACTIGGKHRKLAGASASARCRTLCNVLRCRACKV